MTEINVEEVIKLAEGLDLALRDVMGSGEKVVSKGALNVKTDARRRISGHPHLPHYPKTIGYDMYRKETEVSARIGPDKDAKQGPMGNIIEIGTIKNAPLPHLSPAMDEEVPRFVQATQDMAAKLLTDRL